MGEKKKGPLSKVAQFHQSANLCGYAHGDNPVTVKYSVAKRGATEGRMGTRNLNRGKKDHKELGQQDAWGVGFRGYRNSSLLATGRSKNKGEARIKLFVFFKVKKKNFFT